MSLQLQKVSYTYKNQPFLYEMDLEFPSNSFNILLGATGAGKTSLIRLIAGLDKPSKGKVIYHGKDVTNLPVRKRNNAVVYQQFINYPSMTVFDNIASSLKVKGLPKDEIRDRVDQVIKMLRIERFADRKPSELSGGQQQRCAIARALVKDADVILLDEPLVNLDYKLREDLRSEIREIFKKKETIVFYATTEPEEPLLMGGNVLVMEKGNVLQYGKTTEVYRKPDHINVGQIFSYPEMNTAECELKGGRINISSELSFEPSERIKSIPEGKYIIGIRAHHLTLSTDQARHGLELTVNLAEINGSDTLVHLKNGEKVEWIMQMDKVLNFDLGQKIHVDIKENSTFLFDLDGKLLSSPNN